MEKVVLHGLRHRQLPLHQQPAQQQTQQLVLGGADLNGRGGAQTAGEIGQSDVPAGGRRGGGQQHRPASLDRGVQQMQQGPLRRPVGLVDRQRGAGQIGHQVGRKIRTAHDVGALRRRPAVQQMGLAAPRRAPQCQPRLWPVRHPAKPDPRLRVRRRLDEIARVETGRGIERQRHLANPRPQRRTALTI